MNYQTIFSEYRLWLVSCTLLVSGMILPMFTFQKFFIFNDTFSLLSGVIHLLTQGELVLFLIVTLFSIVTPLYKMYLSHRLAKNKISSPKDKLATVKRLAILGKWSMADVFVISVLVVTVKLGAMAEVQIHIGLFVFCLGVFLSMFSVHRQLSEYELIPKRERT